MSIYEHALSTARTSPGRLPLPPFLAIAKAAEDDRQAWIRETLDARARARRWLLLGAALWLLLPLDALLIMRALGMSWELASAEAIDVSLRVVVPALILAWGARLTRVRRLRAEILVRAIAASSLIVALQCALWIDGYLGALFSILLAIASARSLHLLGARSLDADPAPSSNLVPARFHELLIICVAALVVVTILVALLQLELGVWPRH